MKGEGVQAGTHSEHQGCEQSDTSKHNKTLKPVDSSSSTNQEDEQLTQLIFQTTSYMTARSSIQRSALASETLIAAGIYIYNINACACMCACVNSVTHLKCM